MLSNTGSTCAGYKTIYDFYNVTNKQINYTQNTTDIDFYAEYKWIAGKFVIQPGFRLQYYGSMSTLSPEPRLSVKYNVMKNFRLKMAGGYFTQNLMSTANDLDVVNLFYGFLSGPENLPKEFDGKEVKNKLQQSWHIIFGFEWDITHNLNLNVEGYYKYYPQLTNINRYKYFEDSEENALIPDRTKRISSSSRAMPKGSTSPLNTITRNSVSGALTPWDSFTGTTGSPTTFRHTTAATT